MHVHVASSNGEAKFWIEPIVSLAEHAGLSPKELRDLHKIIEGRRDEIKKAWKRHF